MLYVKDRYQEIDQENEEPYSFPCDMLDGPVRACFEDDQVATPLELLEIFDRLTRHESTLSSPPKEFFTNSRLHLLSMKTGLVVSPFQEQKNSFIDFMVNDACWITKVQPFIRLIWFHVFLLIENHFVENHDEIVIDIGRQGFTEVTCTLHQFFNGNDFSRYVCVVFGVNDSTPPQQAVAIQLATFVYFGFLQRLNGIVRQEQLSEPVIFDVGEMTEVGRSKVRHVGGWAVRRVLSRARKYVQRNVHTNSSYTLATVESQQRACELLEENINQPYHQLEQSSKFPESLQVTEERQYRQRGLLHISDDAYVFFLSLEQRRVDLLNFHVLKRAREDMVEAALDILSREETLKERWRKCFPEEDANKSKELIEKLFHGILMYYINMGASQFLRDYRRASLVKKSAELRKRVLQRKKKTKEKTDCVPYKEILKDRSLNKTVSHSRLVAFIHQHQGSGPLSRVYLKSELTALCQAYGLRVSSRSSKSVLAEALLGAISQYNCIPNTDLVDNRQFRIVENSDSDGHIRIRLSRDARSP